MQETGDKWTVIEILRHIAFAEEMIVNNILDIIAGGEGVDEEFDLTAFNRMQRTRLSTIGLEDVMTQMLISRNRTVNLLDDLTSEDWEKSGRYFTGDIMTTKRMFEILIWHQAHHTSQIIEKIKR